MSSKKPKRKSYSKREILAANARGDNSIVLELAMNLHNGIKMTKVETSFGATMLKSMRRDGEISKIGLTSIPDAYDNIFIELFHAYYDDLDGKFGIEKFSGDLRHMTRVVGIEEKREDVIRLNQYQSEWEKNFTPVRQFSDQVLNMVVSETRKDLKVLDKKLKDSVTSREEYDYRRKGTFLRSKFIYIRVSEVFEDLGVHEIPINFDGQIIEITPWSMVHVLNRHYAQRALHVNYGKDFHQDPGVNFFNDPEKLKTILEQIGSYPGMKGADIKTIYFELNGNIYSVHTENQIKGQTPYIRLQTFYPVGAPTELQKVKNHYVKVSIAPNLSGFKRI